MSTEFTPATFTLISTWKNRELTWVNDRTTFQLPLQILLTSLQMLSCIANGLVRFPGNFSSVRAVLQRNKPGIEYQFQNQKLWSSMSFFCLLLPCDTSNFGPSPREHSHLTDFNHCFVLILF